jgi:hypothetical protein
MSYILWLWGLTLCFGDNLVFIFAEKVSTEAAGQTNIPVVRQKKFYFDEGIDKYES